MMEGTLLLNSATVSWRLESAVQTFYDNDLLTSNVDSETILMLDTFTVTTFATHLGEMFRVSLDSSQFLDLQLIEATDLSTTYMRGLAAGRGRPFSIVFRGPRDILLPQQIYRMEHENIGTFDLFLVPIGPDSDGLRYEAVFN